MQLILKPTILILILSLTLAADNVLLRLIDHNDNVVGELEVDSEKVSDLKDIKLVGKDNEPIGEVKIDEEKMHQALKDEENYGVFNGDLICPFTFESGVTKIEVPDGCVFFGENDVNHHEQKKKSSPALYVCPMNTPFHISAKDFESYGLVSGAETSHISMILPGGDVSVAFYSHDHQSGHSGSFTKRFNHPLFQYKYPKSSEFANDNVLSAVIGSTAYYVPLDCEELQFSDKMHLISSPSSGGSSKKSAHAKSLASKKAKAALKSSKLDMPGAHIFV